MGRVSVSHGGVEYLSGITLPQWPVGAHWAFGLSAGAIGGQYASANRALQFDNLRLRTPLLAPRHAAPLAISFNGQQYTSPLHFSYYRPPVLSAALPASAPPPAAPSSSLAPLASPRARTASAASRERST